MRSFSTDLRVRRELMGLVLSLVSIQSSERTVEQSVTSVVPSVNRARVRRNNLCCQQNNDDGYLYCMAQLHDGPILVPPSSRFERDNRSGFFRSRACIAFLVNLSLTKKTPSCWDRRNGHWTCIVAPLEVGRSKYLPA